MDVAMVTRLDARPRRGGQKYVQIGCRCRLPLCNNVQSYLKIGSIDTWKISLLKCYYFLSKIEVWPLYTIEVFFFRIVFFNQPLDVLLLQNFKSFLKETSKMYLSSAKVFRLFLSKWFFQTNSIFFKRRGGNRVISKRV